MFALSSTYRRISNQRNRAFPFLLAAISLQSKLISSVTAFSSCGGVISTQTFTSGFRARKSVALMHDHQYKLVNPLERIQRRFFAYEGDNEIGDEIQPTLTHIDKMTLQEILSHVENDTGDKKYVVMDVRGMDEISATGKIHPMVHTLPLPDIAMRGAFNLDEDDFEEAFGFSKPTSSDTLVFTCKAGIRSQQAAQFAAMSGYKDLVNYVGGADDWFRDNLW